MNNKLELNLQILQDNTKNIKNAIEYRKSSNIDQVMSQWPSEISSLSSDTLLEMSYGDHCDENGIWHKPQDWPDIESIEIGEDEEVVYLLYGNHLNEHAFASFTVSRYSGTITIDKGIVSNGIFTVTENIFSGSSSPTHQEILYTSQDDYTVYRIKSTRGINHIITASYTHPDGYIGNNTLNACLMRYGQLRYGKNPNFRSCYIESDNILNLGKLRPSVVTDSWASNYTGDLRLQRWRNTGWNMDKLQPNSFASFFSGCNILSDIGEGDFSNWVKSSCVNIQSMFSGCYRIKKLNVSNWDVNNITSMSSTFGDCYNLKELIGINTWTSAPNCTTVAGMFYYTQLRELDLEHLALTDKLTKMNFFCQSCKNLEYISIKGWDLSKVTVINACFSDCYQLKKVNLDNIVPPTSVCTNFQNIFYLDYGLKDPIIIDGWDFTGITTNSQLANLFYYTRLKSLIFRNCNFPTAALASQNNSQPVIQGLNRLEYLDISDFDMNVYTGTQNIYSGGMFLLQDYYPPKNIHAAFSISQSPLLSHDSLVRIFNNLSNVTGTVKITMGAANLSKLSAEEIAIATNKGWTVSAS